MTVIPDQPHVSNPSEGITLTAYAGDRAVLLAINLEQSLTEDLAGFAIKCTPPTGTPFFLPNRLNFADAYTPGTPAEVSTPSDQAPFQQFHWMHHLAGGAVGQYGYEATAMYFNPGGGLQAGAAAQVSVVVGTSQSATSAFELGFTGGYLSSQAYAAKFHNAPVRSEPKSIDFDTTPYQNQYAWLGAHGREMVFRFLDEAVNDPTITLDLFAYDLDEPDIIRGLVQLGSRLRAFLDNAPLHTKPDALEPQARARLEQSAGTGNIKVGHFERFAHNKVMIQRRNGTPLKVLTGSANFSVRGLYVQANSILIFNDARTAALYGQAFDTAWTNMAGFAASPIAQQWFELQAPGLPQTAVCFSPHRSASVSLDRVSAAIQAAKSSVLFAVMELGGGGPVLEQLRALPTRSDIFSYGVTQSESGDLKVYKDGTASGMLVPFAFLKSKIPGPFEAEYSGGMGQVIHHKFVVVDFNDSNPVVFAGSSNLAEGGEHQNGDNLLAIYDRDVAMAYAVEAIRLVDHYHFRATWNAAAETAPLALADRSTTPPWWNPYYDPSKITCRERTVFSR
jgi:hypothetical protein